MKKLSGLTKEQVREISGRIADAFYDYPYSEDDLGLKKYIRTRQDMHIYIEAIVQASYNSGLLYATSEKEEGCLILSGDGVGNIGFVDGMKMILAEKKVLGGLGKMTAFIRACFADGNTIETRMRKAKRKFIRIEVLAVRPEYQKQGFMRQMMEYVYALADERGVPVILDTDDKDKSLRYQHLGMTLDRVRNCGEKFHMYDLIREPRLRGKSLPGSKPKKGGGA